MRPEAWVAGIPAVARVVRPGVLAVYVAADPDALLDATTEEAFRASDERLPYFATLWPAGLALALAVLDGADLAGQRVLDLGCGVGAAGLAALRRGGRATFLDWEPRSLALVEEAARAQGLLPERLVAADWRRPPALGRFDLVLAADVLYEARNGPAVLAFLLRHLAPGGEAWLADPGRPLAASFPGQAEAAGLALVGTRVLPFPASPGGTPPPEGGAVTLWRIACPA